MKYKVVKGILSIITAFIGYWFLWDVNPDIFWGIFFLLVSTNFYIQFETNNC